jgi:homogentisate 1,2-dioxygenase
MENPQDKTYRPQRGSAVLAYQFGLGNEFATEALPGALPVGQNSPQRSPYGLMSELVSGTTFSAPRSLNRRSYLFRIRPSVVQGRFEQLAHSRFLTPPFGLPASPNHYSWGPFQHSDNETDFIDGIATLCGNGTPHHQEGMAIHVYSASVSMKDRIFSNADGEMLIVPHIGALRIATEYGMIEACMGELVVIPRGTKFRVEVLDRQATGFVCENYGLPLRLPELGLIGSNGLANASDFAVPVAAYEEKTTAIQLIHKFAGNLWSTSLSHSPLDVVAWRGTLYPYKYDLRRFVALGTVTIDHPDPSIFSLLTSPSDPILGPNFDVMALTPRWVVAERSFRPPGYHRNCVGEFIVFLQGAYGGLEPGSTTMTNNWTPHGPETKTVEAGRNQELVPVKVEDMLLVLFESRFPIQVTQFGETATQLLRDYTARWDNFEPYFKK